MFNNIIYGFASGIILFFSNILIMQTFFNNYNITNMFEILKYYWLEFTILSNLTKIMYIYNKDLVYRYTLYLVNNNNNIWMSSYPLYSIYPWNFSLLTLTNYIANCDREYTFKIDVWDNILNPENIVIQLLLGSISIYNIYNNNYYIAFICFGLCYQYLGFILYYVKYLEKFNFTSNYLLDNINKLFICSIIISIICNTMIDYFKVIILFQLLHSIIYTHEYLEETFIKKKGSVNLDSPDFNAGIYLYKRPLFYLNILYILIPSIILCV